MKALVLITQNNEKQIKWLFNRVMAIVAYDVDLSVVFVGDGCNQLTENKIWKSLPIYGVDNIFDFDTNLQREKYLLPTKSISANELKKIIAQSDLVL